MVTRMPAMINRRRIRITVPRGIALLLLSCAGCAAGAPPDATASTASFLRELVPAGWRVQGGIESYTPANLYDKINGRSELYMAYAVTEMACVTLVSNQDHGSIEVSLFNMKTPLSAFGVYSMERSPDAPTARIGRQAYVEDGDLFFWKGPFYATLRNPDAVATPIDTILGLGRKLANRLQDDHTPLWGIQVLPQKDLVEHAIQYFMADALALDFLTDTFTAVYAYSSGETMVFLSRADSAEAAGKRRAQFADYLEKYGTAVERTTAGETEFVSAEMLSNTFDVVFEVGNYLAGVTSVPGRDNALHAAMIYRDGLRSMLR